MSGLEGRVREGEERREEEVGRLQEVISQLREQLKSAEEQRRRQETEVGQHTHTGGNYFYCSITESTAVFADMISCQSIASSGLRGDDRLLRLHRCYL